MSAARMITGMIGAFGGGAVGRMLGGRMGGMIGSMAGSMLTRNLGRGSGASGIGDLLGGLMGGDDNGDRRAQAQAAAAAMPEEQAMLLVQAMCNSAKADGQVDQSEIDAILSRAGDLDDDDQAALRAELAAPLDLDGFLARVPNDLAAEVYAVSLLPIQVDTAAEVTYLKNLASGLGLTADQVASIHKELGVA